MRKLRQLFLQVGTPLKCNRGKSLSHVAMSASPVAAREEPPTKKKLKVDAGEVIVELRGEDPVSYTANLEKDVGITEYLNQDTSGFFAVIKRRYN